MLEQEALAKVRRDSASRVKKRVCAGATAFFRGRYFFLRGDGALGCERPSCVVWGLWQAVESETAATIGLRLRAIGGIANPCTEVSPGIDPEPLESSQRSPSTALGTQRGVLRSNSVVQRED